MSESTAPPKQDASDSEKKTTTTTTTTSSPSTAPQLMRHDWLTTLAATITFPPYSMLTCSAIYGGLLYGSHRHSYNVTGTVLLGYMLHALLLDNTAQSLIKPRWVRYLQPICNKSIFFRMTTKYFACKLHTPDDDDDDNNDDNNTADTNNNNNKTKGGKFDPNQSYLFAYHPHGMIGMGAAMCLSTDATGFASKFPGIQRSGVTLNLNFRVPFYKEWLLMNGFCSANKRTLLSRLSGCSGRGGNTKPDHPKESIILIPGGASEALYCKPRTMKLAIRNRKGFVRLAMESNAALVPCIGFGENDIFDTIYMGEDGEMKSTEDDAKGGAKMKNAKGYIWKLQRTLYKMFSFSTPIWTHVIPMAHPIDVVVGEPIHFAKTNNDDDDNSGNANPSVDECHAQYLKALEDLYNKHKAKYGYENVPIEFV